MKTQIARAILSLIVKSQIMLERVRLKLVKQGFDVATEQDIYYCYRLFLNRQPDLTGLNTYKDLIYHSVVTIDYLTDAFLFSSELQENQEKRNQPVLVDLADFQLYIRLNDHFIGAAIANDKIYEAKVTQTLREILQPGFTFLDIGANIGYFSMLAAACLNNTGRIIAFEPMEQNRELFNLSVQANNFQNIDLFPYAVSECEKTFALETGARSSNSRIISAEQASTNKPRVKAVALDDFLHDLTALDVIKLDIEGAEPLALQGMNSLVEKYRPLIITEFSPKLIDQTSQVAPLAYLSQLVNLGYSLKIIGESGQKHKYINPQQILALFGDRPSLAHIDLLAQPEGLGIRNRRTIPAGRHHPH